MANVVKPNEFNQTNSLDGTEELYTIISSSGLKLLTQQVFDGFNTNTITVSGNTVINNNVVNVTGDLVAISGSVINEISPTYMKKQVSSVTDNGDGTFTHDNDGIPEVITVIKPQDYSTTENEIGKYWIDGKMIHRKIFNLPTWTSIADSSGSFLLENGDYYSSIVRLKVFAKASNIDAIINLNLGDTSSWSGFFKIHFDGLDSYINWGGVLDTTDAYIGGETYDNTIILEYTKK